MTGTELAGDSSNEPRAEDSLYHCDFQKELECSARVLRYR